ncbi:DUF4233 domain-containing protein [Nesterenkonia alkaliphila]|uniref:DUF4233 domain-containing protein n=1 Tax=Nesterenkonia alkaliphila TaxID=1463631 RepID=A0A7K1UEA6_9MICC|nr:DUF4233 domain-containing protein [Nesterenkonia alkaliphila]MVT24769.1 DUF4233 domain-containing protein [Nesterenkonia alkaliphila]GFZ95826.1 hypothetical protein GCM10011359_26580 [Nesterenkonia alkaliphila]
MPRKTRAQREWEPGQTRAPRSVKALFASTVLCLEAALMFFFGLTAWGLNQHEWFAWWIFAGACLLAVLCVALCAFLHRPVGYPAGWVLQGLITASFVAVALVTSEGLIVPLAVLPGLAFAACWWYAVDKGAQIDVEKMERYRVEEELAQQAEEDHDAAGSAENEERKS